MLPGLVNYKKTRLIWKPSAETSLAIFFYWANVKTTMQDQFPTQSKCWPSLILKKSDKKSYWAWTNREAYEHASVQFVVHWMQRNLSPMASLQLHTNIYSVSGKEKTPHLRISQALNLTFWALTSNVRGRRTFSFRHFYIYFCENRNI